MMPSASSWRPPSSRMTQMRLGQPLTGSPKASVRMIITMTMMKAMRQKMTPSRAASTSGTVEKAQIPSMA